jgi:adenylosuccinate lyase
MQILLDARNVSQVLIHGFSHSFAATNTPIGRSFILWNSQISTLCQSLEPFKFSLGTNQLGV